jgi:hypothetical protein
MIKISETSKSNLRRPWRRRISNQLAAFAAIMLFASTQIGTTDSANDGVEPNTRVVAQNTLAEVNGMQLEKNTMANQTSANKPSNTSPGSKKRKGLKLDLFLFRR